LDFDEEIRRIPIEDGLITEQSMAPPIEGQDMEESVHNDGLIDIGETHLEPGNETTQDVIGMAIEPASSKTSSKASSSAMVLRSDSSKVKSASTGALILNQSQALHLYQLISFQACHSHHRAN
jgi:hypothetical protein